MRQGPRKPEKPMKITMKIIWLGHSAFRVETGESIILFDPFLTGSPNFTAHFRASARNATHILFSHGA